MHVHAGILSRSMPVDSSVMALAAGSNPHSLACAAADGRVLILDMRVSASIASTVARSSTGAARGVAWSPNGRLLAYVAMDQSVVSIAITIIYRAGCNFP